MYLGRINNNYFNPLDSLNSLSLCKPRRESKSIFSVFDESTAVNNPFDPKITQDVSCEIEEK